MRHATDSDHIVAVTAIASRERSVRKAAWLGAVWGIGHTLTLMIVGGAIIVFKLTFSPRVGLSLEFTVALMLIVLGVLNLFEIGVQRASVTMGRPFAVGVIHGLAGSAAAALLILPLIADPVWAALYLLTFGFGTIVGMTAVTISIAAPTMALASRLPDLHRSLRLASGSVSLIFGLYLAHRIGFTEGLF